MKLRPVVPTRCRPALRALGWLAVAIAVTHCTSVRRFLVPPPTPEAQQRAAKTKPAANHADLALVAASVYGVPGARSVTIRGDRVLAVGTPLEISATLGPATRLVSVSGGVVMPGWVDAHVHLQGVAQLMDAADLRGVRDRASLAAAVRVAQATADEWLWGFGMPQETYDKLSSAELEAALEGKPAYLSRADGHGARVTAALHAWLTPELRSQVVAADGRIDEVLAQKVWRELPSLRAARLRPLVRQTLMKLQRVGLTEVHAMGESATVATVLAELEHEGRLPMRVKLFLDYERPEGKRLLDGTFNLPYKGLLEIAGVKLWLDGTLGARTAALSKPYADRPGESGKLLYSDAELQKVIERADRRQLQVALHAIGDAAVMQITRVIKGMSRSKLARPVRIEHAQVVDPQTLQGLEPGSVECSIQPRHAEMDKAFAQDRLGAERLSWAYRGLELAERCPIRVGSDMPVLGADPLADRLALLRSAPGQMPKDRAERLALAALTSGGTAAGDVAIRSGSRADLVVWSADPLLDPQAKPLWVVVAGVAMRMILE